MNELEAAEEMSGDESRGKEMSERRDDRDEQDGDEMNRRKMSLY